MNQRTSFYLNLLVFLMLSSTSPIFAQGEIPHGNILDELKWFVEHPGRLRVRKRGSRSDSL